MESLWSWIAQHPQYAEQGVLDRLGFRYEVDNDGDFKVQVLLPGGRSQVGFINSGTQLFCGIEIREIWSLVPTGARVVIHP